MPAAAAAFAAVATGGKGNNKSQGHADRQDRVPLFVGEGVEGPSGTQGLEAHHGQVEAGTGQGDCIPSDNLTAPIQADDFQPIVAHPAR